MAARSMYPPDPIDKLIQDQIAALPKWCNPEAMTGTHQWEPAYTEPLISIAEEYPKKDKHFTFVPDNSNWTSPVGPNGEKGYWEDMSKFEDRLTRANVRLPYNRCKHCHLRSNDDRSTINYVNPSKEEINKTLKALGSSYFDDDGTYTD